MTSLGPKVRKKSHNVKRKLVKAATGTFLAVLSIFTAVNLRSAAVSTSSEESPAEDDVTVVRLIDETDTATQPSGVEVPVSRTSGSESFGVLYGPKTVSQRHAEYGSVLKAASIIQGGFGVGAISTETALAVLMALISKYAQQVLENLLDDSAKKTSDYIKKRGRAFKQELRRIVASPQIEQPEWDLKIEDLDTKLTPEAAAQVKPLSEELLRRSQSDPDSKVPRDPETVAAFQDAATAAYVTFLTQLSLSHKTPISKVAADSERLASYIRYRAADEALRAFVEAIQTVALQKIVDAPIVRPSALRPSMSLLYEDYGPNRPGGSVFDA